MQQVMMLPQTLKSIFLINIKRDIKSTKEICILVDKVDARHSEEINNNSGIRLIDLYGSLSIMN